MLLLGRRQTLTAHKHQHPILVSHHRAGHLCLIGRVDWASTPQDRQAPSGIVDYSQSPVTPPILKRQPRVYGNQTPYLGAKCHYGCSDSGYPQTSPSLNSTGNSNYSSYVSDFSLSPGGTQLSPVSRCTVKPKKFDGKNRSGYKMHFLSVAQANC